ncbi:MAG: hypothetical protein AAF206_02510 [Bacteroidota bacterium]
MQHAQPGNSAHWQDIKQLFTEASIRQLRETRQDALRKLPLRDRHTDLATLRQEEISFWQTVEINPFVHLALNRNRILAHSEASNRRWAELSNIFSTSAIQQHRKDARHKLDEMLTKGADLAQLKAFASENRAVLTNPVRYLPLDVEKLTQQIEAGLGNGRFGKPKDSKRTAFHKHFLDLKEQTEDPKALYQLYQKIRVYRKEATQSLSLFTSKGKKKVQKQKRQSSYDAQHLDDFSASDGGFSGDGASGAW